MFRRLLLASIPLLALTFAVAADAKPKKKDPEEAAFKKRIAALKKQSTLVAIKMRPDEDPTNLPLQNLGSGAVLVAKKRTGLYTPPLITPDDILDTVNQHMVDVRTCYKKQLEEDPEWSDELILDVSVKKSGRVSEVSVSPRRVKRATVGQCLMSAVPRWKFPEFTGETDDGINQEVVNASFPFAFSTN